MNPDDEKYAQQLIERIRQQNQMMQPVKLPERKPERISDHQQISDQAMLNSVSPSAPPEPAPGVFDVCPQCGTMHPPIPRGKKCPVAKTEVKESGLSEERITKFVVNLRDIAISQIESKKIKDGNKLFQHLTVEFMKLLEAYSEQ